MGGDANKIDDDEKNQNLDASDQSGNSDNEKLSGEKMNASDAEEKKHDIGTGPDNYASVIASMSDDDKVEHD
jgi:hypothetical protein